MRGATWRRLGRMAAFLLTSLAACSSLPAVPEYPDLPPEPQTLVVSRFHLDRPENMPPRLNPEEELPCPEFLPIDPVTHEASNPDLFDAWQACRAALGSERPLRRSWQQWEDRERESQRRTRVVGTDEGGS